MLRSDLRFIGMAEPNEVQPRIAVQFTCPKCGGHDLYMESADVLGCQPVKGIDGEGRLVFDRPKFYTEESHFYLSCPDCAYEPEVDFEDEEPERAIIGWLNKNFREPANEASKEDVERGNR